MKKRTGAIFKPWHGIVAIVTMPFVIALIVFIVINGQNVAVFNPQGSVGQHEKDLILFTLSLSAVVVIPVFTMLGVFAWKYREGNHKAAYHPDDDGNRWLELLWWGIPIVIIGVLCVVTWVSTHQLDPLKPLDSKVKPLRVQVVALQWKWLFLYPDQKVATVDELNIPAGTPVNFEITADAPMSAFWIPSLGTQVYAMTGMSMRLSLIADHPGVFRGTNSNINGEGYADMDFTVNALSSRRDFDLWAQSLAGLEGHNHLEWDEYEELAKPTTDNQVIYYHLHDTSLYTEIINKYMHSGHDADAQGGHKH